MAAYAQFGYGGYPSASQLLSTNAAQASLTTGGVESANNNAAPAHSPTTDCRTNVPGSGELSSEALSPDVVSPTSSAAAAAGLNSAVSVAGGSLAALESAALGHHVAATGGNCCENGRPIMTDPVSGQTVCSCQYDSARLALSSYSRLPAASVGVYGAPYPSTDQNPYQSIGVDSSAFYSPLSNPYALKDTATGTEMTAWTSAGLQPTTGYYSYDPMSAYGYGASYDLAARRKNATRESTATLKAWLNEHKKNPYPTKGEKIMLAIITKMTLTQVSTWFANARRRLKKENKMTWEPKNRTDDDDEALVSDDEKEKDEIESEKSTHVAPMHSGSGSGMSSDSRKEQVKDDDEIGDEDQKSMTHTTDMRGSYASNNFHSSALGNHPHSYHPYHHQHPAYYQHQQAMLAASYNSANSINKIESIDPKNQLSRDCGVPIPATKPKIWSLADTVACKTPPPTATYMGQVQQQQQQHHQLQQHVIQQRRLQQMNGSHNMLMPQMTTPLQHSTDLNQQSPHMMSDYVATPYSRVPTTAYGGFLGATTQQLHTTSNIPYNNHTANSNNINNNNISSNNNNNSNINHSSINNTGTHTPTIPIITNPLAAHQQQVNMRTSQNQHVANQQVMGFPEAQPDTPPQTPPNLKVQSVAANLLLSATQAPMIGICRSSNMMTSSNLYPSKYTTNYGDYSPRDENSSTSSCSSTSSQLPQSETKFKPLFNSHQLSAAGFVPPV